MELLEIPKGLIEVLPSNGFTIEKILDNESSCIAEKLGIDPYVGEIIYKETEKAINKINSDLIFFIIHNLARTVIIGYDFLFHLKNFVN